MEVFIVGPKAGSSMAFILHDAAVVISIALQNGVEPVALAKSIARVPAPTFYDGNNTLPASIIGAVLSWLVRLCDEWGNQNAESK